jgi:peptidoglycan/xylan/chitin deacetylase (PgdA/CDA1 family)
MKNTLFQIQIPIVKPLRALALWVTLGGLSTLALAQAPGAVVLQYHFVAEDTPFSTSVSPARFAEHLDAIEALGAQVLPLQEILATLRAGRTLPEKVVAITFDDAYESIALAAHPRLRARGWPYTIFVNTEPLDQRHGGFLTWDDLRKLVAEGATVGNHGLRHDYMVRGAAVGLPTPESPAYAAYLRKQVAGAQARIDAELGPQPKLFAYPYGEYAPPLERWLAEAGYAAFGQHSGPLWAESPAQALPRFPASGPYGALESLRPKLSMRAMAIEHASPEDMRVGDADAAPVFSFALRFPEVHPGPVQCYATGEGAIPTRRNGARITAQAPKALAKGRSRYNCTAQGPDGRWHWVSQPFLRLN